MIPICQMIIPNYLNFVRMPATTGKQRNIAAKPSPPVVFRPWHAIALLSSAVVLAVRAWGSLNPAVIEYGYSRTVYPYIAAALSQIGALLPPPHSLSEMAVAVVFLLLLSPTVVFFREVRSEKTPARRIHRRIARATVKSSFYAACLLAALYTAFNLIWGLNYLRLPFSLETESSLSHSLKLSVFDRFAERLSAVVNHARDVMPPPDAAADEAAVDAALFAVTSHRTGGWPRRPAAVKHLRFNRFFEMTGISGIFLPIFMEPHVNSKLLDWERPSIAAHEKAHFLGFASETDANLIAYTACLTADAPRLRYSGGVHVLLSLSHFLPPKLWRKMVWNRLAPPVKADVRARYRRIRKYADRYTGMFQMSRAVNGFYLKFNAEERGVNAYRAATPILVHRWATGLFQFSRQT